MASTAAVLDGDRHPLCPGCTSVDPKEVAAAGGISTQVCPGCAFPAQPHWASCPLAAPPQPVPSPAGGEAMPAWWLALRHVHTLTLRRRGIAADDVPHSPEAVGRALAYQWAAIRISEVLENHRTPEPVDPAYVASGDVADVECSDGKYRRAFCVLEANGVLAWVFPNGARRYASQSRARLLTVVS